MIGIGKLLPVVRIVCHSTSFFSCERGKAVIRLIR
jgi:hypothetical protein